MELKNKQKEISDDVILISESDLDRKITYVNQDFIDVTGRNREELIGNHMRIIRHPDVPTQYFAHIYDNLTQEKPYRGITKVLCKDGSHCWVDTVFTILHERGKPIGLMAVRRKASQEQILEAEILFQKFRDGKKFNTRWIRFVKALKDLSVKKIMSIFIGFIMAAFIVNALAAHFALTNINKNTKKREDIVQLNQLIKEIKSYQDQIKDFMVYIAISRKESEFSTANHFLAAAKSRTIMLRNIRPEDQDVYDDIDKQLQSFFSKSQQIARRYIADFDKDALSLVRDIDEKSQVLSRLIDDATFKYGKEARLASDSVFHITDIYYKFYLLFSGLLLLLVIIVAKITYNKTVPPFDTALQIASRIASRDLAVRISSKRDDETGRLLQTLQTMVSNFIGIISRLRDVSAEALTSADILKNSAEVFSQSTNRQVQSANQSVKTIDQLSESIDSEAEFIKGQSENIIVINASIRELGKQSKAIHAKVMELGKDAKRSANRAQSGDEIVSLANNAMSEIKETSAKIESFIGIITDISDQTNLLSLNAAIEAARAGESGRGFAIVAEEISKLSDKTVSSVKEITKLISQIHNAVQNGSAQVGNVTDILHEIIRNVNGINEATGVIIEAVQAQSSKTDSIAKSVDDLTDLSSKIEKATKNQMDSTHEISRIFKELTNETYEIADGSKDIANRTFTMRKVSESLDELIDEFKLI